MKRGKKRVIKAFVVGGDWDVDLTGIWTYSDMFDNKFIY